ncbi:MAG: polysaccharide pyruvyl transferase family protein [Marinifilaceae bacterium]
MKKRNICILTQPLRTNYGGILQAYALQKVLRDMGHDVVTDRYPYIGFDNTLLNRSVYALKQIVKCIIGRPYTPLKPTSHTVEEMAYVSKDTNHFIDKHIATIDFFEGKRTPSQVKSSKYDTFIVGSDQVWRPIYSAYQPNYFLDFLQNEKQVKRIAYAASFGVDFSEYDEELKEQCKKLIKQFQHISVREESAIDLCKELFDIDVQHQVDPTLLLSAENYNNLIPDENKNVNQLMVYILDKTPEQQEAIQKIATKLKLEINELTSPEIIHQFREHPIDHCVAQPVETWLQGFRDAKYVITDSFHGTVFSIIYNKPFITLCNSDRGKARFTSLLKMFNLEHRLITDLTSANEQFISQHIDFHLVNKQKETYVNNALNFLKIALS